MIVCGSHGHNPTIDTCHVRCRENLVKLEVIKPGMLNAVVFWFDLHLDDTETLSNGE